MGILRADRIAGLGGANAITGSTLFSTQKQSLTFDGSDINFDTGDFTVEAWIFHIGGSDDTIISDVSGWTFAYGASGNLRFYMATGSNIVDATSSFISNEWVHVAVVRSSGTLTFYQNGTAVGSHSYSHDIANNSSTTFIGKYHSQDLQNFIGHISNFRIIQGRALYTGAFTPPTSKLEKTSDTVLLTCNSASDVLREETGKILSIDKSSTKSGSPTYSGPIPSRFTPNTPVGFSTTTDVGTQFGSTFDGVTTFDSQAYFVPPGGNTRERNRGRALYAGGYKSPNTITAIDFIQIQSGGLTEQFGDLSTTQHANCSACSSSTRMVTNGGWTGSANNNIMEFVTIANSSNSTNFGDLDVPRRNNAAASNQTRGLVYGGNGSPANTAQVDFFTIATAGNAADFGDASSVTALLAGSASSSTRALFAGGYTPSASATIDLFTIASTGDATNFGNLSSARKAPGGLSSSTRSVFGGGGMPSAVNTIDFVTTATTGTAIDFGDLFLARAIASGTSNKTRGIFMGGTTSPARQNTIDFVTIASTGGAVDFGDFTTAKQNGGVASDSHGGL